jgi:predicted nuclease of predicted toxin-antitoxin system
VIRIIVDQKIPSQVCAHIRTLRPQWDVLHVQDVELRAAADTAIFNWAQEHSAIMLTFDEDFADARMFPLGRHAGVIRLKVWPTTIEQTERALRRLLEETEDEALVGSLVIIDNEKIRIRRSARHG